MTSRRSSPRLLPREFGLSDGGRAANVLGTVLLVAFVVPFAVFAAPQLVGAESSYVVLSGSMQPSLDPGDVIVVYGAEPAAIEVGDVVTFSTESGRVPTTHRVVEVVRTDDFPSGVAFRTKGDANEDPDPALVPGSRVVGRVPAFTLPLVGTVLFKLPYLGYAVQFVNTTVGFVLFVALPLLLLVVNEGWQIARRPSESGRSRATDASDGPDGYRATETEPNDAADRGRDGVADPRTNGTRHGRSPRVHGDGRPRGGEAHLIIGSGPDDGFAIRARDLTVAVGVLALAVLYTGWTAYTDLTAWSVAAAVAAFGGLVFAVGLRRAATRAPPATASEQAEPGESNESSEFGESGASAVAPSDEGPGCDRIVRATLPPAVAARPQVQVDSREVLLAYADVIDRLVIEDEDTGACFLSDGGILYTSVPDPSDPDGERDETPATRALVADGTGEAVPWVEDAADDSGPGTDPRPGRERP